MSQKKEELDDLIEEFLDHCELYESGAMGAGLNFDTSIDHLAREQRRKVIEEFIKFTNENNNEGS